MPIPAHSSHPVPDKRERVQRSTSEINTPETQTH